MLADLRAERALAAILGHADLRTVMKYCHPQETYTAGAMRKYHGGPKGDQSAKGKGLPRKKALEKR